MWYDMMCYDIVWKQEGRKVSECAWRAIVGLPHHKHAPKRNKKTTQTVFSHINIQPYTRPTFISIKTNLRNGNIWICLKSWSFLFYFFYFFSVVLVVSFVQVVWEIDWWLFSLSFVWLCWRVGQIVDCKRWHSSCRRCIATSARRDTSAFMPGCLYAWMSISCLCVCFSQQCG